LAVSVEVLDSDAAPRTIEAARALLLEYGHFVTEAEGPAHFCFGKLHEEINGLPDYYRNQGGQILLAYVDREVAGCVTWHALSSIVSTCEMKRLWVRPAFRGLGVGERLVVAAITHAEQAGFEAMYLDTFPGTMKSAFDMYRRLGFMPCDPYSDSVFDGVVFMRRALNPPRS
jgi:putative acetyltransferase